MNDPIQAAAQHYGYRGIIEPGMAHLIMEEGFVPGQYDDDVGVKTEGVGQTGENIGANFFTETYPKYEARAREKVKNYNKLPEKTQMAVLSAVYRGDLGPKAAKLIEEGKFEAAAKEYLNHKEYRQRKRKNPEDGVVKRMERNAEAIRSGDGKSKPKPNSVAGRGVPRQKPL